MSIFTVLVVPDIVTVEVALLNVPPLESQLLGAVKDGEPDIVKVPPLLTRTSPAVPVDVVAPTERSVPVIVRPPESVRAVLTLIPLTVRLANPAVPFSLTVFDVPLRVIVEVPFVNVPALESQLPEHVQAPLVKLRVVPVPTVTLRNVTVAVVTVSPPVPTSERDAPPVMLMVFVVRVPEPEVANVLVTLRGLTEVLTVPEIVRL